MRADSQIVAATLHFEQMTGFVDQVVWEPVLLARASAAVRLAERELAATAYRMLARTYADAEGAAASVRDSVAQLVETIRP